MRLLISILLFGGLSLAQAAPFASVEALHGQVSVYDAQGQTRRLTLNATIEEGDLIETGMDGEIHLLTQDDALLAVRPNSRFRVERYRMSEQEPAIVMNLFKGALRSLTGWLAARHPSAYRLHTPSATIGVRGTDHETSVLEQDGADLAGTYDSVLEGRTVLATAQGALEIAAGEHGYVRKDAAPERLQHAPRFLERRTLRLEKRIGDRRPALRERIQRRLERLDRRERPPRPERRHP